MARNYVEVTLDQFDDEAILEAAEEILRNLNPDSKIWATDPVVKLGAIFGRRGIEGQDDALPPASTAARITTMSELRACADGFAA